MSYVQIARFLDSAVLSMFLMCLSGGCLFMFSQLWLLTQAPHLAQWKVGQIMKSLFPFTKRFEFNLIHVLLFSALVCLLSLRPSAELTPTSPPTPKTTERASGTGGRGHRKGGITAENQDQ